MTQKSLSLVFFSLLGGGLAIVFGPRPKSGDPNSLNFTNENVVLEPSDNYSYFVTLLVFLAGLLLFEFFRPSKSTKFHASLGSGLVAMLFFSASWNSKDLIESQPAFYGVFTGFSLSSILISTVASLLILAVLIQNKEHSVSVSRSLMIAMIFVSLPSAFQPSWAVSDPNHFAVVGQDILSWQTGLIPLSDYSPMFTSFLGIPIALPIHLFPQHSALILSAYLMALMATTLLLIYSTVKMILGASWAAFATLLVLLCLQFQADAIAQRAMTYYPINPVRIFLPMLIFWMVMRIISGKSSQTVLLGITCGIAILNNVLFGLATFVSVFVVLSVWHFMRDMGTFAQVRKFLAAVAITIALIFSAYALSQTPISLEKLFIMSRLHGTGYGALPMDVFGLHIVYLGSFLTLAAIAYFSLKSETDENNGASSSYLYAVTAIFSILTWPYFVYRSMNSQLMGGFAIQFGLTVALIIHFLVNNDVRLRSERVYRQFLVVVSILFACVIAGIPRLPDPYVEFDRVRDGSKDWNVPAVGLMTLNALGPKLNLADLNYIGENQPFVSSYTGMKNGLTFAVPELIRGQTQVEIQCKHMRGNDNFLINKDFHKFLELHGCQSLETQQFSSQYLIARY